MRAVLGIALSARRFAPPPLTFCRDLGNHGREVFGNVVGSTKLKPFTTLFGRRVNERLSVKLKLLLRVRNRGGRREGGRGWKTVKGDRIRENGCSRCD
jgi:hypothetical protein